jgi:hypothetical protein
MHGPLLRVYLCSVGAHRMRDIGPRIIADAVRSYGCIYAV